MCSICAYLSPTEKCLGVFYVLIYLVLKACKTGCFLDERSFHNLMEEGKSIYNTILFLKKVGVNSKGHVNYEGRSNSSRKSTIIFLFCKSAELNYYSCIDEHDLYLYSKFCCSGMNTMLTVVAMEARTSRLPAHFWSFFAKSRCLMMTLHLIVYRAFSPNFV